MTLVINNILTALFEKGESILKETDVYIDADRIVGVGSPPPDFAAGTVIDGYNKLLLPGLINAHTHSYMTLFRNYADDLPFDTWLFDNIIPLEDKLTGEDCYWGSMLGIMEMLRTGTTCFFDMYLFINETSRAVAESGIRACLSRGLVGEGPEEGGQKRLRAAKEEIAYWGRKNNPLITFMLSPHAPYTCTPAYLARVIEEAKDLGLGLCIHLAESRNEIRTIRDKYNCTPAEYLDRLGFFALPALAAHCVYLTENDMDILAEKNVSVVTNPVSNLKLANGFAPLGRMQEKGINICLGTDGAASNNTLNLFKDLQFVTLIHKGRQENAELIRAADGLRFATVNGAKALGLSESVGCIKAGMQADLIILDIDRPQFYPRHNLLSALAYSATGDEVETVIVNGQILFEKNEYKTIDAEKVLYHVNKISKRK
ncbi:MAG: amidohydrolase [bacterium]|jgi:5-methylthioadenosine/S-adenosylhomocysteine deaminase